MTDNLSAPVSPDTEVRRGFAEAEFEARTAKAQGLMAEYGLDGLLLTTEPEVRYFSGFLSQFWLSPTRPWFLLVPASGKPVAVVPSIGAECFATTWLDDIRSWPSPQPDDEGVSLLAKTIREVLGAKARIGLLEGPETYLRMALKDFRRLSELLPEIAFSDATDLIKSLRLIKSPAEVEKIAHACAIVSNVFDRFADQLATGMDEVEIFKRFKVACLEGGIDNVDYLVGGAGPGGYTDIISPPSTRATRPGDVLMLDTGAVFDGYFCDFDRNYAFDHVTAETERAYAALLNATDAGLKASKPGVTCADVFQAIQGVLEKEFSDGSAVGRMGHGLGMQLTEWPSIAANDRTELQAGMVLTIEPSVNLPGGRILVHEENFLLTPDGPKLLTLPGPASMPVVSG